MWAGWANSCGAARARARARERARARARVPKRMGALSGCTRARARARAHGLAGCALVRGARVQGVHVRAGGAVRAHGRVARARAPGCTQGAHLRVGGVGRARARARVRTSGMCTRAWECMCARPGWAHSFGALCACVCARAGAEGCARPPVHARVCTLSGGMRTRARGLVWTGAWGARAQGVARARACTVHGRCVRARAEVRARVRVRCTCGVCVCVRAEVRARVCARAEVCARARACGYGERSGRVRAGCARASVRADGDAVGARTGGMRARECACGRRRAVGAYTRACAGGGARARVGTVPVHGRCAIMAESKQNGSQVCIL